MCERLWRNAQDYAVKQGLAVGSRGWLVACKPPEDAHEWSMQRSYTAMPAVVLQDKKFRLAIQLARSLDTQLSQVTRPSCQSTLLWKNWFFAFLSHSSINTPYTHEILRASRENFKRETLEKNKIDSSTIFTKWLFEFLISHPLHCYILKRFFNQIPFSPYSYLWEGYLVLWEAVRKEPIHIGWYYRL